MWLTRVAIGNPYLAAVAMLAIVVLGLFSWQRLSVEEFPDIRFPVAVVTVGYPGAAPSVVESEVTRPLEEAVNAINGVKNIRSYSFEGSSVVVVEFVLTIDPNRAVQDVRDKVAGVQGRFRREIGVPTVNQVNPNDDPMMTVIVASASASPRTLTTHADQVVRKRLQTVPGVGEVQLVGGVKRELRVHIDPYRMQALGLDTNEVVNALRNANQDFPAGRVQDINRDYSVRLSGKLASPEAFGQITVGVRNGAPIRLDDVAQVLDGQEEYNSLALINGQRALSIEIKSARGANVVDTSAGVYAALDELRKNLPAGMTLTVIKDQSRQVKNSLADVKMTLLEGAALTVLIVFVFLASWRSTVITGLTLPIALIGTLFAIAVAGFTLNVMTLLALSLSIGLLIDDAIVVRENIVRHARMGKGHYQAAVDGTEEIGLAVLATTLTVVAVFLPVGFMGGIIGKFFQQFGLTVTVAVLISLLVSFTLDPMLSSIWHDPHAAGAAARGRLAQALARFEAWMDRQAERYARALAWALAHRKTTLAAASALFVGSLLLAPVVGGEFVPKSDTGKFIVKFKTAPGSSLEYTEAKAREVEALLRRQPEIKDVYSNIGGGFAAGRNQATLRVFTTPKAERERSVFALFAPIRQDITQLAGVQLESIEAEGGPGGGGKPVRVGIRGADFATLAVIANQLRGKLAAIPHVSDVESSFDDADPALSVEVKRDAAARAGVNLDRVGATLSTLLAGTTATTWEAPDGENYDVRVQIPRDARSTELLDVLTVASDQRDADGQARMIPLSTVADVKVSTTPRQIDRMDQAREVTLTANIQGKDARQVFQAIDQLLKDTPLPPGYRFDHGGQSKDMAESFSYAVQALAIGVIFIYMILVAQFRSFSQPLAIMMSLPLGIIGVMLGLLLWGSTLNLFSVIGVIMLMGLAAKNGILLVDFANQARREGMSLHDALLEAGRVRMRPILMTSFAMIFGMLPLAMALGEGAETRAPMAHAVIGGMVSSTVLTLIVTPVVYSYLEGVAAWWRGRKAKTRPA